MLSRILRHKSRTTAAQRRRRYRAGIARALELARQFVRRQLGLGIRQLHVQFALLGTQRVQVGQDHIARRDVPRQQASAHQPDHQPHHDAPDTPAELARRAGQAGEGRARQRHPRWRPREAAAGRDQVAIAVARAPSRPAIVAVAAGRGQVGQSARSRRAAQAERKRLDAERRPAGSRPARSTALRALPPRPAPARVVLAHHQQRERDGGAVGRLGGGVELVLGLQQNGGLVRLAGMPVLGRPADFADFLDERLHIRLQPPYATACAAKAQPP
jgi:hypothetical protein